VLEFLDLNNKSPQKPQSPGRSYSAALNGKADAGDEAVYFEFENTRSIRTGEWKYIARLPDGPNELYNLTNDADERHNLVDRPAHAERQKELQGRLDDFFNRFADPKYDLSRGGRSKATRRTK
jgi:arylsulfatase A-like enzyme